MKAISGIIGAVFKTYQLYGTYYGVVCAVCFQKLFYNKLGGGEELSQNIIVVLPTVCGEILFFKNFTFEGCKVDSKSVFQMDYML